MDVSRMPKEGDRFGNWTITRILSKGGMGVVYLVRNPTLRVERALKVLDPAIAERNREFVDRFNQEAALVCGLHSPHLVEVYDAGCEGTSGFYYIVMEYLGGGTLRDRMRCRGRIPWREALGIVRQVALALTAVEKRHSVHRDIKPENILFTSDGVAKLVDFGIAKAVQDDAENMLKTLPAQVFGTPAYMSPEQVRDASSVDARADIWSLGIVFFEMLAGSRPYPATNIVEVTSFLLSPRPLPDIRTFKPVCAYAEEGRTAVTLPTMETRTFCAEGKRDVPGEVGGGSSPAQREQELDVPEGVVSLLARMCEKSLEKRVSSGDKIVAAIDEILASSQPETATRTVEKAVPPVEGDKGKTARGSGCPDDPRRRHTLRVACAGLLLLIVATGAVILLKPYLRLPVVWKTVAAVGPPRARSRWKHFCPRALFPLREMWGPVRVVLYPVQVTWRIRLMWRPRRAIRRLPHAMSWPFRAARRLRRPLALRWRASRRRLCRNRIWRSPSCRTFPSSSRRRDRPNRSCPDWTVSSASGRSISRSRFQRVRNGTTGRSSGTNTRSWCRSSSVCVARAWASPSFRVRGSMGRLCWT